MNNYQSLPVNEGNLHSLIDFLQKGRKLIGDFKFIHTGAIYWGVSNLDNLQLFIDSVSHETVGFAWYDDPLSADYATIRDDEELHTIIINWLIQKANSNPENRNGNETFGINCFEDDTFKMKILQSNGFVKDESDFFLHQVIELRDIPDIEIPEEFVIRTVQGIAELHSRAELHRQVFSTPEEPSQMSDEKYSRIMNLPGYNTDLFIDMVAHYGDEFTCFAGIWIDKENNVAYVEPVGTKEQYRKKGLARTTIYSALQRASSLGCTRAIVLSYGEESKHFYENLGFIPKKKEFNFKKKIS